MTSEVAIYSAAAVELGRKMRNDEARLRAEYNFLQTYDWWAIVDSNH